MPYRQFPPLPSRENKNLRNSRTHKAFAGERAREEMIVATWFAESLNPLVKSKASANTTAIPANSVEVFKFEPDTPDKQVNT
jgi:hypothetical protein